MPLTNIANLFHTYIRSVNITRFVKGKQNTIFPSETGICISEASVNWLNMPFNAKTPRKIEFSLMAKKIRYKLWLLFRNIKEIDTKSSRRNNPRLYCLTVSDVSKTLSLKRTLSILGWVPSHTTSCELNIYCLLLKRFSAASVSFDGHCVLQVVLKWRS